MSALTNYERSAEQLMLLLALGMLILLIAAAILARPITPIDETRYVGVAWEMWLRGDFLVPFKNGGTYSHKPPLMMWMFQAGWALFGVNEWWPRLVSPLFSAGGLLLTFALAKRLWPERSSLGGEAVIILTSCLVWAISSTWIMFDVMLAFFVLIGMHGTLIAANGKLARGFALLGLSIGLGVLTKGPVMLLQVLPVVVLAPWWNPGLRWARWFGGMLAAVILGAAIALGWAIPAGIAGGEEYRNAIFWGQTANRMVESFAHQRPIWWYMALMPVLLFPWIVWSEVWRAIRRYTQLGLDRGGRFCVAWTLPVFIAFSFISGKQVHYLMPLFPAFALFVARVLSVQDRPPEKTRSLLLPILFMLIIATGIMLVAGGIVSLPKDKFEQLPALWPGLVLALAAIAGYFAVRKGVSPLIGIGLLGMAAPALVQIALAPALYAEYDVHPISRAIRHAQDSGHLVVNVGKYHDQYQFFGRLQQPLVELQEDELKDWLQHHPAAYVVMYLKSLETLKGAATIASQPYRGKVVVLLDAITASNLLTHLESVNLRQED